MSISFFVPIKADSTANMREHHFAKAARLKAQKAATLYRGKGLLRNLGPLVVVRLTRIGARELDSDNLQSALKSYRDGVATALRIDDASPLVRWEYAQDKGSPGVRVEVAVPILEAMKRVGVIEDVPKVLGVGK